MAGICPSIDNIPIQAGDLLIGNTDTPSVLTRLGVGGIGTTVLSDGKKPVWGNASLLIGMPISGGIPGDVLVVDPSGLLGQQAPGALTKTDDTNVTLLLGGTPATALLQAVSLTLGWSGQLSIARGGTSLSAAGHLLNATLWDDVTAGAVVRGDVITGQGVATKWARLAKGTANQHLAMDGTATDVLWVTPTAVITDHAALSNLSWTVSGHTGTASRLAAFAPSTGAAALIDYSTDFLSQYALLAGRAGTNDFTGNIGLTGNLKLPTTTSTVGQILSASSTLLHTLGTSNTFLGVGAGSLTLTGRFSVGIGTGALASATFSGDFNTAVGRIALGNLTSGTRNVAIGSNALAGVITGNNNVAVGTAALSTATGSDLVAVGDGGMQNATTAVQCVSVGSGALAALVGGNYNTAIGYTALQALVSSQYNTAVGRSALSSATSEGNTALGLNAGLTVSTGDNNTLIGNQADVSVGTIAGSTAVGYLAIVSNSAYVMLGKSTDCVGIGGAARPTGSGGLIFPDGTALSSMASNTAALFADDVSGNVGMYSIAENGVLSQHIRLNAAHLSYPTTYISGSGTAGADGTAQTIKSIALAANTLTQVGDRMRVRSYWIGDNGGPITGSSLVGPAGSEVLVSNTTDSGGATLQINEAWLHYVDNTHANIIEDEAGGLGAVSAVNVAGFTWNAAQVIIFTQDNVANNHCILYALIVDIFPKGITYQ